LGGRSYLLNLYFLTSLGPGAKPLVEFFEGPNDGQLKAHRGGNRGALSVCRVACRNHREISQEPQIHDWEFVNSN